MIPEQQTIPADNVMVTGIAKDPGGNENIRCRKRSDCTFQKWLTVMRDVKDTS
ncbi:hypothetical protein O1612_15635 [Proteus mirabilis]|nr:hypothetical protein [Proteus mirabilis]MCZ4601343.1 hypothetical protein [Proteus mirabilis]